MEKLNELKLEYRTIKTKAFAGVKISKKEAKRALVIKKKINQLEKK